MAYTSDLNSKIVLKMKRRYERERKERILLILKVLRLEMLA